eukprot:UN31231
MHLYENNLIIGESTGEIRWYFWTPGKLLLTHIFATPKPTDVLPPIYGFFSDHLSMMSLAFTTQFIWSDKGNPAPVFQFIYNVLSIFSLDEIWKFWLLWITCLIFNLIFCAVVRTHRMRQIYGNFLVVWCLLFLMATIFATTMGSVLLIPLRGFRKNSLLRDHLSIEVHVVLMILSILAFLCFTYYGTRLRGAEGDILRLSNQSLERRFEASHYIPSIRFIKFETIFTWIFLVRMGFNFYLPLE